MANPIRYAEIVNCTCEVGAPSRRPIDGSDARYMSTDSGPSPVSMASSSVRANEPGRSIGRSLGVVAGHAKAMKIAAVDVEPELGAIGVGADAVHQPPEARRVVHLDQVRDLVHGE